MLWVMHDQEWYQRLWPSYLVGNERDWNQHVALRALAHRVLSSVSVQARTYWCSAFLTVDQAVL
jgi:hypothetical protein